jgi:hypothetical protein
VWAQVILADSVASAEGKLYIQGAGWSHYWSTEFPATVERIGVGVVIHVPWTATNEQHTMRLQILDADGAPLPLGDAPEDTITDVPGKVTQLVAQFNAGRPPQVEPGADQVVTFAVNFNNLTFEGPGRFSVRLELDGTPNEPEVSFSVQPVPGVVMAHPR